MKKIIAILTQKGLLSKGISNNTDLNIFEVEENDKVIGYENIKVDNNEKIQVLNLLKSKKINLLYIDSIANDLKDLLEKIGITVRSKEEHENDKFINSFIFA